MKKLLILTFLSFAFNFGYSQNSQYIGTPDNTVIVRNNLTANGFAELLKSLTLHPKTDLNPGGNNFNGLLFIPRDTTADWFKYNLSALDHRKGDWYEGTTLNKNVNFGLLAVNDDQVTTLGPNYNRTATGGAVIDSIAGGGWRWEDMFPTGNDSVPYTEIHLSHFPGRKYKPFGERRLISFQATNGQGAINSVYNRVNSVSGYITAGAFKYIWSVSGEDEPMEYLSMSPQGLNQVNNINVSSVSQGFSLNGLPVATPSNYAGEVGAIMIGAQQKRVSINDTLEIDGNFGIVPVYIQAPAQPLAIASQTVFISSIGATLPSQDPLAIFSLNPNNELNPKGWKESRMRRQLFSEIVPGTIDKGLAVYDSTLNVHYQWNSSQWAGSYSGYVRTVPVDGDAIAIQNYHFNIIDPATPLNSLSFNWDFNFFIDGDQADFLFTKPVASVSFPFLSIGPFTNVSGHMKLIFVKGVAFFTEGGGTSVGKTQYVTHPTFTVADSLVQPDIKGVNELIAVGMGTSTQSGNGSTTAFTIAHGLTGITSTSKIVVTPRSSASAGSFYVTTDATNITITYVVAPGSGTNNLTWTYNLRP